jgi:hypothetical protein
MIILEKDLQGQATEATILELQEKLKVVLYEQQKGTLVTGPKQKVEQFLVICEMAPYSMLDEESAV